jgi:hypothetical protein
LITYLSSEGFTKEVMNNKSILIRTERLAGATDKGLHQYIYYFFSDQLSEQPINIIVRREMLERLADIVFEVKA